MILGNRTLRYRFSMALHLQQIRFCSGADGERIAYATSSNGPPLAMTANRLTHLEHQDRRRRRL
jgi:hypothetical protein